MLGHLAKLASRSAQLREAAIRKEAGLIGAVAKGVGGVAAKNPGVTAGLAIGGLFAGQEVAQKTKQFKAGFDPNSQKQMMGQAPTPPGV